MKRLLLAAAIVALFGFVSKSFAEEQATQQAPITIDALSGKITVHPIKPTLPEQQAAADEVKQPPGGSSTPEKVEPADKPKIVEFGESDETKDEIAAVPEEESSTEPMMPGEEERASFDVPTNGTLIHEGTCVGVMEDGKLRACRYEDILKHQ